MEEADNTELILTISNQDDEDGNPFTDFTDDDWRDYLSAMSTEQILGSLMDNHPPEHILDEFIRPEYWTTGDAPEPGTDA